MPDTMIGCIGLFLLLVLFLTGIELSFAMAIIGFIGFAYVRSFNAAVDLLAKDFFDSFASYAFTVIPLFILMGQVAFNSGMAEQLYKTARKFIGHVPGGLGLATVIGATLFKAISGSTVATAATFSGVAIPEMDKYGYSRKLSTGVVASVGTLGMLLPPSGFMIILAMITEQSVGKLFIAGIVPGLIAAVLFFFVVVIWCKVDPSLGPRGPVFSWKDRISSVTEVIWPVLVFCVVIGGLLGGFFTPTEAGSAGAIAVMALTILKKDLSFKAFVKSVNESLRMSAIILMLLGGSTLLGHFVAVTKIPLAVASWTVSLSISPYLIMIIIICIYLLGGSFIDDAAFTILATPIFFPVMLKLGFDPIWICVVIGVTLMIGVIVPPMAISVFIVQSITKEAMGVVYKGSSPFLFALVAVLLLLFLFPGMATWLPALLMG